MSTRAARSRQHRAGQMKEAVTAMEDPNAVLAKFLPTGASAATARQDGLSAGISASHRMAQTDLPRLRRFQASLEAAAVRQGLPPALLAAIASRESRAGATLDANGLNGPMGSGDCFGLMQLDSRYHRPLGGPFSSEHLHQAARVLGRLLDEVKARHPGWPPEQQLRGAVVAYDAGVDCVRTIKDMDRGSTGEDYSNDVWARAQALAPHFGGLGAPTAVGPASPASGLGAFRFLKAPATPSGGREVS